MARRLKSGGLNLTSVGVTSFSYPMANATTSGDIMDDIIPEVTSSDYALVMMASFNRMLLARGPR